MNQEVFLEGSLGEDQMWKSKCTSILSMVIGTPLVILSRASTVFALLEQGMVVEVELIQIASEVRFASFNQSTIVVCWKSSSRVS
jgi:hypothetical protein